MRAFKQACLTMVLLFVALVALNTARLGRAPAQVGFPAIRNGDVDCDGQINITDPLVLLNWLFSDGPEPCAIAQTEPCCTELQEELAALRATVDALAARIPGPSDMVTLRQTFRVTTDAPTTVLEVPENKRFVVTSASFPTVNLTLVSIVEGNPTPITLGLEAPGSRFEWSSGFALPQGADVGLTGIADPGAEVYLNGYLLGQ